MEKTPAKTTIEIYWENNPPTSDEAHDLFMTMGLCGFSRKPTDDTQGPDLWVRDKAGRFESYRWLDLLCERYQAKDVYIRPEYSHS